MYPSQDSTCVDILTKWTVAAATQMTRAPAVSAQAEGISAEDWFELVASVWMKPRSQMEAMRMS